MSLKNSNIVRGAASTLLGIGVLGATYSFVDQHEVKRPEDAAFEIMLGDEVVTYVDEPEIPVAALGLMGSVALVSLGIHRALSDRSTSE